MLVLVIHKEVLRSYWGVVEVKQVGTHICQEVKLSL